MCDLINKLFPFIDNQRTNTVIKEKINCITNGKLTLDYMNGYERLSIEQLKDFYNDTFEIKNSFEDKAKINVVGLTISISLILGLSDLITRIEYYGMVWLNIIVVILSIFAIGYMAIASILSISVLIKENVVNKVYPEDLLLKEEDLKKEYAKNTEINVNRNIIRNNYIYTSYECITNSLIILAIIFFIISICVIK